MQSSAITCNTAPSADVASHPETRSASSSAGAAMKQRSIASKAFAGVLVLCGVTGTATVARADEGGVSFWLPGFISSLAATPLQPGWSFAAISSGMAHCHRSAIASSRPLSSTAIAPRRPWRSIPSRPTLRGRSSAWHAREAAVGFAREKNDFDVP